MDVTNINGGTTTSRGTKIIKAGSDMDKDAFLRILSAELSNQDPTSNQDSTQYVAQMAQFTSLEQMSNLNSTMTLNSANALMGKGVTLNTLDPSGNEYTGIVRSVTKAASGDITLNVEVNENGTNTVRQFSYTDVNNVIDVPDYDKQSQTDSLLLLTASNLIGKKAEFDQQDPNGKDYVGTIKTVSKNGTDIVLTIQLDGQDKTMDIDYSKLKNVTSV